MNCEIDLFETFFPVLVHILVVYHLDGQKVRLTPVTEFTYKTLSLMYILIFTALT